ncbi:WecB/TagA/CpsF family glycosyltransferase [Candidatus Chloroploca sp. M-50]|uniref:WecB/TagA/CpsF family glycosyltransferase n=1 Tax=Candidatus Chloroploca mongolica TaxID=2528176 RepID=A0ABS4DB33_9CHLR|nr:WecB/TagA/CpsF family glycosyltransferase [Candidatus Chloroploca mongolica]MBP1466653.1 WecB/TagA/CpsF family glycosyltransferase [Candidatus Chloroploca mongolica]
MLSDPSPSPDEAMRLPDPQRIGQLDVHPVRLVQLLAWLEYALACTQKHTVFYANIYAVNLAEDDAGFKHAFAQADLVFCDGQGLRLGAALLGKPLPERFTPPDWIDRLAASCAARGYGLFLLGGEPGVAATAAARLIERHPGLRVASHHGYLSPDPTVEAAALEAIAAFQPALLLVGMGMPIQERWVTARRTDLAVPVVMTVGALFDYLAQTVPRGPRWLTDHGFEWLCRLWYEPQRLWRRYLLGIPRFFGLILRQKITPRG